MIQQVEPEADVHTVFTDQEVDRAADLGAMVWIAAHCELYSGCTSNTMRTARSRTSGENFVDFFIMAPSSQRLEPPPNPGRLNLICTEQDDRGRWIVRPVPAGRDSEQQAEDESSGWKMFLGSHQES